MRRIPATIGALSPCLLTVDGGRAAAFERSWSELKGPHFTTVTEASERQGWKLI